MYTSHMQAKGLGNTPSIRGTNASAISAVDATKVETKRATTVVPDGARLFGDAPLRARAGTSAVHPQLQALAPRSVEAAPALVLPTPNESPIGKAFDALPVPAVEAKVRLLEGNTESWLSIWDTISTAKQVLDASYFIFNRDVFGAAFLGGLVKKAREGTKVRLLLDASGDTFGRAGFTQTWRGQDYLQALLGAGGQVRVYHPLHKKIPKLLWRREPLMGISVNHDKLVRNERQAVTGGRNVSSHYFVSPSDRPDVYRDTDVLVRGAQASRHFREAFETEFSRDDLNFQVTKDRLGDWHSREGELIATAHLMDAWLMRPALDAATKAELRTNKGARTRLASALVEAAIAQLEGSGVSAPGFLGKRRLRAHAEELVAYTELAGSKRTFDPEAGMQGPAAVKVLDRTSIGRAGPDTIAPALKALAAAAKHRILITNPYVVMTEDMLKSLEDASKRGVKIDVLTNSPDSSDSVLTQAFFLSDWPKILARVPTMRLFVFTGEQKLHAKTMVADDEIAAVGSYNLDLLSSMVNGELMLAAKSRPLARELGTAFANDLADPAQAVREYTIARNADGTPKLVDGKPIVTSGPEDHMSGWKKVQYAVLSRLAQLAKRLPFLSPLALD